MFSVFKLQLKDLFSNKACVVYMLLYVLCTGLVFPIVASDNFLDISIIFITSYFVQIGPNLFVMEKECRTFETLVSMPISMKKIFSGKVVYSFSTVLGMYYVSTLLAWVESLITNENVLFDNGVYMLIWLVLIPVHFYLSAVQISYMSLKATDSKACAMAIIPVSILYSLLPIILSQGIKYEGNFMLGCIVFYCVASAVIAIVLHCFVKKYYLKENIFNLLKN